MGIALTRKLNLLLIFFAISISAFPQDIADTAFEKTVFWRITGNGLKDTSFLYGTAHPIFREDIRLTDTMVHVLLRSSAVFFENLPGANDDSLFKVQNLMEKPNLRRVIGSVCYTKLIATLKSSNDTILDDPLFGQLMPQYLNARILSNVFGKRLTSVDALLLSIAIGNNQPVFALDRPEFKTEMITNLSTDQQADNLFALLNDFKKRIERYAVFIKQVTNRYNAGDISFLYTRVNYLRINDRMSGVSYTLRKTGMEELLDKRNKEWMGKIESACRAQPSFFAFGAAHLAGKKGIISLLRKKGYTITPIFMNY